ncbi:MAG: hypothetical protein IT288_10710 [Bdellovibrionales bacterium]|nr:hypothetical protein [Bdellovibrionales bacterium]
MRFAIVNGEKREAEKGLAGICIGCAMPMLPVCGVKRQKHWRHKVDCECDHWWENETDWHREWKNCFPSDCQEIRHQAENGEWHIADVKTAQGWVLEFQNSPISLEERDARNTFYRTIVWIVNGARLKRDKEQFFKALEQGIKVCENPQVTKVFSSESSFIEKWIGSRTPVYFDFGDESVLWCMYPTGKNLWCFVSPVRREDFVLSHQGKEEQLSMFLSFWQIFGRVIEMYAAQVKQQRELALRQQALARSLSRFEWHLARQRSRRRF